VPHKKPLIWVGNRTRGTPYVGVFAGEGGSPRMLNSLFRLQRFQLGGKKGHAQTMQKPRSGDLEPDQGRAFLLGRNQAWGNKQYSSQACREK
jgi:hypothetical protein